MLMVQSYAILLYLANIFSFFLKFLMNDTLLFDLN